MEDNSLFYNVLPKNKRKGPLVNTNTEDTSEQHIVQPAIPTAPVAPGPLTPGPIASSLTQAPSSGSKKILAVALIVLSLVALGGAGFFAYSKFKVKKDIPKVELVVNQEHGSAPAANTPPPENTQPQITTPKEWQKQYFNNDVCNDVSLCGDEADPDRDGLSNVEEYRLKTDPNNPDSDGDSLADGDEVNVFGGNPLKSHSFGDNKYSDADMAKGGYDPATEKKYTADALTRVKSAVQQKGFHVPTLKTIGDAATNIYGLGSGPDSSTGGDGQNGLDSSSQAKLDRDSQRSDSIKKIGAGLLMYKKDKKTLPQTTDFDLMTDAIKPYLLVATNTHDPINQAPYVYQYAANSDNSDFTLTYQSETQNTPIKYKLADAQKDVTLEAANQNDDIRSRDLDNIRSALLVYSSANVAGAQSYVFPTTQQYKTALVPKYINVIPKDPKTNLDYEYKVSATFDSFTLKATFENPDPGTTGYMCNQEECKSF